MTLDSNRIIKGNKTLENKWNKIEYFYRCSEQQTVAEILKNFEFKNFNHEESYNFAKKLVAYVRENKPKITSIEHFLKTHKLNSQEGLAVMCLAEALLRIPDTATRNAIIQDKITSANWQQEEGLSLLNKLTNLGLLTSSKILNAGFNSQHIFKVFGNTVRKLGTPVIRTIILQAIKIISQQFITGETIQDALKRSNEYNTKHYNFSYDMLGEAAHTQEDADEYFNSYMSALNQLGNHKQSEKNCYANPGISIKLSSLHPRYEFSQRQRVYNELLPRCLELAKKAKDFNLNLTIDAEESERLMLSLEIAHVLLAHPDLNNWNGLGLAVQTYQKRAPYVIDWICELAIQNQKQIGIRLVKGAYWDAEIKQAQIMGYSDYAVFTQKCHTDLNYLYCAEKVFKTGSLIFPQFATHNAHKLAAIHFMAKCYATQSYEFQRLHGMGDALYNVFFDQTQTNSICRIYAPVGEYKDLMPYLIRRLLENGANSSFMNQIYDSKVDIEDIINNPIKESENTEGKSHKKIPNITDIYQPYRKNSSGRDLTNEVEVKQIEQCIHQSNILDINYSSTSDQQLQQILNQAIDGFHAWSYQDVESRALCLSKMASLIEKHYNEILYLLVKEAHKTFSDAVDEVREAIDFCHYYSKRAVELMKNPVALPSPTGEHNHLYYHPRGVFVCISPWNFPFAIFLGQVLAAVVTGNSVIAKTAQSTPKIATFAVSLAHQAGIPQSVLQLVITKGSALSKYILENSKISGVVFTGSTETALKVNQTLAKRNAPIASFIAETGGINAMIVDSSAFPEQVVTDVIASGFQSAGQRCSALRVLYIQEDVADIIENMLIGAMKELKIDNPEFLSTDIGPVIDKRAQEELNVYINELSLNPNAKLLYQCNIPTNYKDLCFIAPQLWQVQSIKDVTREAFGPIVHMIRYKAQHLDRVIEEINSKNYGLTFGLHTRLESTIRYVKNKIKAGNSYINRNMIGAVVCVQPFGGEGFSGTGFKAGGPNYLLRFVHERTVTNNVTAIGGNTTLLFEV